MQKKKSISNSYDPFSFPHAVPKPKPFTTSYIQPYKECEAAHFLGGVYELGVKF